MPLEIFNFITKKSWIILHNTNITQKDISIFFDANSYKKPNHKVIENAMNVITV